MKRSYIIVMTLAAVTGLAAMGQEPRPGERWQRPEGPGDIESRILRWVTNDPKAAEQLGLKEDQVQAIKNSLLDLRKESIDLNAKMELAAVNQAELMSAETIDEAAVMKAVEETGKWRTEIAKVNMRRVLAVHKILTPEQRNKLKAMIQQRMKARMENRGKRMGQPPGAPPGPQPAGPPAE